MLVGAVVGALTMAVASVVGSAAVVACVVGDGCTTAVAVGLPESPPQADSPTTATIVSTDNTAIFFTLRIFFFPPSKSMVPFAPHPLYALSANLHSYTHSECRDTNTLIKQLGAHENVKYGIVILNEVKDHSPTAPLSPNLCCTKVILHFVQDDNLNSQSYSI
jgi:hypothetical protein